MTLKIIQGNRIVDQENVSSALVAYLYNLANTNQLDNNSNLVGNLYVPGTYLAYIDKLTTDYTDLHITAGKIYVPFTDPEFGRIMMLYVSSDGLGVTTTDIESVTNINYNGTSGTLPKLLADAFHGNQTITSLKDLMKTNVTGLDDVFMFCSNVTEIGLPASLTRFGRQVLYNNSALKKVIVEDLNAYMRITYVSDEIFKTYGRSNVKLYEMQNGQEVEITNLVVPLNLGTGSLFLKCASLQSVTLQEGVTTLPKATFAECANLTSVTLPSTLTEIGDYSLKDCPGLTSITLPSSVTSIGNSSFYGCSNLASINLSNVTYINQLAFFGTKLTSIDLSNLLSVGGRAPFMNLSTLKTVTLGNKVKNITDSMFNMYVRVNTVNLNNVDFSTWNYFNRCVLPGYDNTCPYNVLNFTSATAFRGSAEEGPIAYGNSATQIPQLYLSSIIKLETNFDSGYSRAFPKMGVPALHYNLQGARIRVGLLDFKDLTDIESQSMQGVICLALVINNTTPPTYYKTLYSKFSEHSDDAYDVYIDSWGNIEDSTDPSNLIKSNQNGGTYSSSHVYNTEHHLKCAPVIDAIYVPDSAVNTYKSTTGWSLVANKIKGISELNNGTTYTTEAAWEAAGKPLALIDAYM